MAEFQFACKTTDVPPGSMKLIELQDRLAIIVHVDDQFYCLDDVCTHDGGTLSDGELVGCQIACPRHGAKFDVRTGEPLTMPATEPTGSHAVKLDGESVYVMINE